MFVEFQVLCFFFWSLLALSRGRLHFLVVGRCSLADYGCFAELTNQAVHCSSAREQSVPKEFFKNLSCLNVNVEFDHIEVAEHVSDRLQFFCEAPKHPAPKAPQPPPKPVQPGKMFNVNVHAW